MAERARPGARLGEVLGALGSARRAAQDSRGARATRWLVDGVSTAGRSRRGHLRPAEGTWLGEFRPAEQGLAEGDRTGARRGSSCRGHPGSSARV